MPPSQNSTLAFDPWGFTVRPFWCVKWDFFSSVRAISAGCRCWYVNWLMWEVGTSKCVGSWSDRLKHCPDIEAVVDCRTWNRKRVRQSQTSRNWHKLMSATSDANADMSRLSTNWKQRSLRLHDWNCEMWNCEMWTERPSTSRLKLWNCDSHN